MPLSLKAADLLIAAVAQAGMASTLARSSDVGNLVGALSVGSIITAVGAVFVMREKTARNERDISEHKSNTSKAHDDMARAFAEALKDHRDIASATLLEHRREMLAETAETRTRLNEIAETLGELKGIMSGCPLHIQQGDK
jgi:uncharacterized protein with WD repeat